MRRPWRYTGKSETFQGECWTLDNMGKVYSSWGQYQKALEHYEKSLEIARKIGNMSSEGVTLNNIGNVHKVWGQYEKGLEYLEKGLRIHRKVGNVKEEAVTLGNIGDVYRSWGYNQKALEQYQKCLETSRSIGDERTEVWSLGSLGLVYYDLGQYQQALECFQKSLEIARKIGAVGDEALRMNNIALVYSSWGHYQKALEYHEKALEVYRQAGNQRAEGTALNNMADVYQRLGQYQLALQYSEKSLEIKRQIGDVKGEADTLSSMGKLLASLGKTDEAMANFQKGLEIRKRIGVPTHSSHDLIGNLYLDMGDIQQAEAHIVEGAYNSSLGRLCLLKSNFPEAKNYYEKLLREAEQNRNADNLFTAYTGLGKVYESLEDYKKAEEYYEKGIIFTEEIRSSLLPSERKEFFSVKINGFFRSEPGKGLTRVQMKLNQASGSIDSSEVTRARAFADNLFQTSTSGPSGVPREVLEKEDMLVTRVAALKKELAKTDREKNQARYEVLTLQVKEAEVDLRSFVEMLWEKHRAYAAVKYPRPVPLKNSALHSDEYVIMFDCFEDGVGVKVVKGKEIVETHYSKFKQSELEKDIRTFREPFETVKFKDFDPALAQRLYKRLLAPVMAEVPEGSPLIIIPDGCTCFTAL